MVQHKPSIQVSSTVWIHYE